MSRSDWLKGNIRVEFTALKRLQYFCATVWKRHAESRGGFEPDPDDWPTNLPATFEHWYDETWISKSSSGRSFLATYDNKIVPHLKRVGIRVPD